MKKLIIITLCILIGCSTKTPIEKENIPYEPVEIEEVEEFLDNCVLPYKGMDEKHIDDTLCGPHASSDQEVVGSKKNKHIITKYYWYAANEKDIPLIVECSNGIVESVYKYFDSTTGDKIYWNEDGTPNFNTFYEKKHYVEEPDYDVLSYDNPDDFYEDHDLDFEDYEEAEEYWEDWH